MTAITKYYKSSDLCTMEICGIQGWQTNLVPLTCFLILTIVTMITLSEEKGSLWGLFYRGA